MPARFLRLIRLLLACAVLGVVAAPARPVLACRDAVVLVAEQAPRTDETREAEHEAARPAPALQPRIASRAPAGARAVVVQHRVYLKNASLLR
jgi:hypothetical protein